MVIQGRITVRSGQNPAYRPSAHICPKVPTEPCPGAARLLVGAALRAVRRVGFMPLLVELQPIGTNKKPGDQEQACKFERQLEIR